MPDRVKIKEWLITAAVMLTFTLAFVWFNHFLKQNSANRDDAKLKEVQSLAEEIKPYPDSYLIATDIGSKSVNAGVYNNYKSKANYDDVKAFYTAELTNKDWVSSEDGKQLIFKKEDLIIAIAHSNQVGNYNYYSVSFVWRQN